MSHVPNSAWDALPSHGGENILPQRTAQSLAEEDFNLGAKAVLVARDGSSAQDRNIAKILAFFGVSPPTVVHLSSGVSASELLREQTRVLCSAEVLLSLVLGLQEGQDLTDRRWRRLHSIFVYAGHDYEVLKRLATLLLGSEITVSDEKLANREMLVSPDETEFCGAMAGLRINVAGGVNAFALHAKDTSAIKLISGPGGAVFLKMDYKGVPIFLSTSKEIIDIDAPLSGKYFDVRDHFASAVPIVTYIKWAFAGICWTPMETDACLVLDDPLLKPNYGYLNYDKLLRLMQRNSFSTTIGFIPWNCQRTDPVVAKLFREHPNYFSLAIHGSNHTAGEFGTSDREFLSWKAREAVGRMVAHKDRTGIQHDPVMVFPHGVFSKAAMDVLKQSNFIAAVNSNVVSIDTDPDPMRISDVWDVAVMRYRTFPMFTRRDPSQGVENFAFDILLGKPCITVLHHDFCRGGYKHLLEFIDRLNGLRCNLSWRGVGEVIKRSCRMRKISTDLVRVEMYATQLRLENGSDRLTRFFVQRRECEPSMIDEIQDGRDRTPWNCADGYINFEIGLRPQEARTIAIQFHELPNKPYGEETGSDRLKAMLRRYLSEFRDNYFVTTRSRFGRGID